MALGPGSTIGPFKIQSLIGKGGMGEIFLATDTRLNRNVAIKILPAGFAADAQRLNRFESEAKSLAALNHPNILSIFEVGRSNETPYLVSELLEGKTLREEMNGVALPVRKATDYAPQIAHGLAAAHGKGIVHRDLKPENIFVTKDGRVKILDFGLAKLHEPDLRSQIADPKSPPDAAEPTVLQTTEPGMVLGTPAYMSPEQVRGEPADHRADIFAFGCVLYEMLSGARAFRRNTPVESMHAVLNEDPAELSIIKPGISISLERLMRRCLEKDPENRFQSAKDLAFALEGASNPSEKTALFGSSEARNRSRKTMWMLAGAGLVALGFFFGLFLPRPGARPETNAVGTVRYLTHSGRDGSPAASPDGKRICFTSDRDGTSRIWLRDLASGGETPLTTGPDDFPRFSPEGSAILFTRSDGLNRSLYRVPSIAGEPLKIVDNALIGDWSPDGRQIAFVRWEQGSRGIADIENSSLHLIGVDGSGESLLARLEGSRYTYPRWSPDGKKIAVSVFLATTVPGVAIVTVATGNVQNLRLRGLNAVSCPIWAQDSARVIYMQPETGGADSTSTTARIFEQTESGAPRQIGWSPAFGRTLDVLPPRRIIFNTRSSRVNLKELPIVANGADRGVSARLLTAGSSTDRQPVYSPDGEWIAFSSNRSGNLEIWEINRRSGVIRRLTDHPGDDWDPAFSPDGKFLVWSSNRTGQFEIWIANSDGTNARQVTRGGLDCENPAMTPDGKWIAYTIYDPQKSGVWKIRPNGLEATQLFGSGRGIPEISPDGKYVASLLSPTTDLRVLHVLSLETGQAIPFEMKVLPGPRNASVTGRLRWMPNGKAIAFTGQDERGVNGVYMQDFVPGQDTSATRRPLGGFDPEHSAESFGISPDGQWLTVAAWEQLFSIMVSDALPSL